ncbi:hypothetical protein CEXT_432221 [Caerostris extrusa]|uniref:Uncharacterized protein n=1 Tax=Caerostris extrusa TaxID=172846 RepID=A0AAV4MVG4_CAEEX|nr:hypothetical protein CEXT_432221 [Caerostris extrusa]
MQPEKFFESKGESPGDFSPPERTTPFLLDRNGYFCSEESRNPEDERFTLFWKRNNPLPSQYAFERYGVGGYRTIEYYINILPQTSPSDAARGTSNRKENYLEIFHRRNAQFLFYWTETVTFCSEERSPRWRSAQCLKKMDAKKKNGFYFEEEKRLAGAIFSC